MPSIHSYELFWCETNKRCHWGCYIVDGDSSLWAYKKRELLQILPGLQPCDQGRPSTDQNRSFTQALRIRWTVWSEKKPKREKDLFEVHLRWLQTLLLHLLSPDSQTSRDECLHYVKRQKETNDAKALPDSCCRYWCHSAITYTKRLGYQAGRSYATLKVDVSQKVCS